MDMSSVSCTRPAVSRTLPQSDDRYVVCFGQSVRQPPSAPTGHTLISDTFQSLTIGFAGSLFHWKYIPLTTTSAHAQS